MSRPTLPPPMRPDHRLTCDDCLNKLCRVLAMRVKDAIVFERLHGVIDGEGRFVEGPILGFAHDSERRIAEILREGIQTLCRTVPAQQSPENQPPPTPRPPAGE